MKRGFIAWLVAAPVLLASTVQATQFPIVPSITVAAIDGSDQRTHATPVGSSISLGLVLGVLDYGYELYFSVDIYVGVKTPDGRFLSFVGDPKAPSLVAGPAPVPWLVSADVEEGYKTFVVPLSFTSDDPQGWYVLYGVMVEYGASFPDPANWMSTSFFPLLVHPAAGAITGQPGGPTAP